MLTTMTIGDKLRYFRKLRKMTQEQVAEELGISDSAYAKYETGESDITIGRLTEIAKVFLVKEHEILAYEKEQNAKAQVIKQTNHAESNTQIINNPATIPTKNAVLRHKIDSLERENDILRKRVVDLETINELLKNKK